MDSSLGDLAPPTTPDNSFLSNLASENGDMDQQVSETNLQEDDDLEDRGEDGELATDAEVESLLSGAPSLPEEASESLANGNGGSRFESNKNNVKASKSRTLKNGNYISKLKQTSSTPLKRSTSGTQRMTAPSSPKPFLRSSTSKAAARRTDYSTDDGDDGHFPSGNGNGKILGPPVISATPIIRKRVIPNESASLPVTRRSSVGPGTLSYSKPTKTTDPRRTSLSGMASPVGNPRRNSMPAVTSMTRSVDLSPSDSKSWSQSAVARTPPLKASGRPSLGGSPRTPSSPAPAHYLKRTSPATPEQRSPSDGGKPPSRAAAPTVKPPSPGTGSVVNPSATPPNAGNLKSPISNGVASKGTPRKKLSPSSSLGPRRTSCFAEPVGMGSKLSMSSSFSSPSDRSLNLSSAATFASAERLQNSSSSAKLSPSDKLQTASKGSAKYSPSGSSTARQSPSSSFSSPIERLLTTNKNAKLSPSLSFSSTTNSSGGLKHNPSSPVAGDRPAKPSPTLLSADRGPSMLTRRKSLTSDTRDSRFIALPPVDVKAGDDVRLDLRGQKVRTLDGNLVNLTPKMEFVYLRDNKLSSLDGIEILRRVKVLDLSFNEFKGAGFEPLATCKALQQLYLAGNQITSLSGLPQLPNLEFLSVAQNRIKSLNMASQPRLQVLAASKNKISTLKGFPHLPALEHLRLEENPILECSHVEAQSIILVGPTLKKFNDRDLSTKEQELAGMYPPITALCIREGWELCDPEEAAESTLQFLVSQVRCSLVIQASP